MERELRAYYDRPVDVLIVRLGEHVMVEGDGRAGGVELDFDVDTGIACEAKVIGFRRNFWSDNLDRLAGIIADHLSVSIDPVKSAIQRVVAEGPRHAGPINAS